MRMTIDAAAWTASVDGEDVPLDDHVAFARLRQVHADVGWSRRYAYGFTWLGHRFVQLPEDILRWQEAIWDLRPQVIIETGIAHGGRAVISASMCRLIGHGQVIAIDTDLRPHNEAALAAHPLADSITVIDGSSTDPWAKVPGGDSAWIDDNPLAAIAEFLTEDDRFAVEPPRPTFDETMSTLPSSYWEGEWLRRIK